MNIETPRLNAAITAIMDRAGTVAIRNAPKELFDLAKELETELAALREDRERLDWLEEQAKLITQITVGPTVKNERWVLLPKGNHFGPTVRAAIDAARKEATP